jgi:putative ABC transport system permease protein
VLDGIDAQGASSSIPIALLAVDEKYGDVLAALPAESPQHASAGAVRDLLAPAGDPLPVRLPVLVDSRLAGVVGLGDFTLDLGSASVPATVSATLPARPGYLDGPIAVIDRERFRQVLDVLLDGGAGDGAGGDSGVDDDAVADALDSLARPSSVLAVGPDAERTRDRIPGQALSGDAAGNASESVTVLRRSQVLADEQQGAFASGIATATLQTVLAAGAMALLGLIVTTVLGARRRGRTLALLGALGVPARAGLALAAGELAPLVAGGVVGGVIAAGVVLITAAPALGIADPATVAVPAWLAPAALLAAVAALALALVVDTPLSRRVRSADILRTGEES